MNYELWLTLQYNLIKICRKGQYKNEFVFYITSLIFNKVKSTNRDEKGVIKVVKFCTTEKTSEEHWDLVKQEFWEISI